MPLGAQGVHLKGSPAVKICGLFQRGHSLGVFPRSSSSLFQAKREYDTMLPSLVFMLKHKITQKKFTKKT